MTLEQRLIEVETAGWEALSTPGAGAEFYRANMTEDALMVFGFGVLERAAAIDAMAAAPPWSWFRLEQPRVVELSEEAAVLTYRATAQREGDAEYSAWTTSVYVRFGSEWRLAFHQQTPVS